MYASGAIPDMPGTVPRPGTFVAVVFGSPAAIPATCVPCSDCAGSNGSAAGGWVECGGGKARATITFAVVKLAWPLGKPAGIVKADGSKNGCRWSTPSSMTPIFMPWPAVESVGPQTCCAPTTTTLGSTSCRYVTDGYT